MSQSAPTPPDPSQQPAAVATDRRSKRMYPTVLLLLVAASGLGVWALGQVWVTSTVVLPGMPAQAETATGSQLYPAATAGAWFALACVAALVATKGRGRFVVGALIVIAAAAVLTSVIAFPLTADVEFASSSFKSAANLTVTTAAWWILVAAAGLVIAGCGVVTLIFGRGWRSLSSRQGANTTRELSDWEKLDRGQDPTTQP